MAVEPWKSQVQPQFCDEAAMNVIATPEHQSIAGTATTRYSSMNAYIQYRLPG